MVVNQVTPYTKLCWLKTATGGWCTGVRLSSVKERGCIFGCAEVRDELCHYLQCPHLWNFAREHVGGPELNCSFLHRLCLLEPSVIKLKRLAFCHSLYHTCVNNNECVRENGMPYPQATVLARASQLCHFCIHRIGGPE